MVNLDLDVLRSFVAGLELGSFSRAADRLGRSTSAVSAQLKKLEDQVGTPVLRKSGRGLVLTPAGEIVLSYSRRMLELNDAAVLAVRGAQLIGCVRIGFQEDFGEGVLTEVLGIFARTHPEVTVDTRIARNVELESLLVQARLDLALTWQSNTASLHREIFGPLAMCWIGDVALVEACRESGKPVPLVVFDAPCVMRNSAIEALDRAGIAWRIVFTSSSLSGIWAAARAGLGITVRTAAGKPADLPILDTLPALPDIGLCLNFASNESNPVLTQLADIVRERLLDLCAKKPLLT